MADPVAHLIFKDPAPANGQLIFGASDAVPPVEASLDANLGQLEFSARFSEKFTASIECVLPGLALTATAAYNSKTDRPLVGQSSTNWESAQFSEAGITPRHENASSTWVYGKSQWQTADQVGASLDLHHTETLKQHAASKANFESAQPAKSSPVPTPFQDASRTRRGINSDFATAGHRDARTKSKFQDCFHDRRAALSSIFSPALPLLDDVQQRVSTALAIRFSRLLKYQNASRVNGKNSQVVPPVVPPTPCYVPSGYLLFAENQSASNHLLFVCERKTAPDQSTIIIPVRRVYLVTNEVSLYRASDMAEIPVKSISISFSDESWIAGLQATLQASALPLVKRNPDPVEVIAVINGVSFRFFVQNTGRKRGFDQRDVSITGDGIACELDAPIAPEQQYFWSENRTAQQLINDALIFTGYTVDWQITDWLVPGNVASIFGPPASVAKMVAESVGAVLSAHHASRSIRVLPKYKKLPWEWATATPDIQIPAAVTEIENIDWVSRPNYNAVFISGEQSGVLGHIKRAGSAGDKIAQMVTHKLITHADAARQRGQAILANTGQKAMMQISIPVLPEIGVIDLGALVEFSDGAETRRGIVRANRVDFTAPKLRQNPTIEAWA